MLWKIISNCFLNRRKTRKRCEYPLTENPKIYITPLAYAKMNTLTRLMDKEVAGFMVVENHIITDILIPPQKVSGSSVDIDAKTLVKWILENNIEDEKIRGLFHSHNSMGAFSSGIDDGEFNKWREGLGFSVPYLIEVVTSKRNGYLAQILINEPIKLTVKATLEIVTEFPNVEQWCTEQIKEKVTESYTYVKPYQQASLGEQGIELENNMSIFELKSKEWLGGFRDFDGE